MRHAEPTGEARPRQPHVPHCPPLVRTARGRRDSSRAPPGSTPVTTTSRLTCASPAGRGWAATEASTGRSAGSPARSSGEPRYRHITRFDRIWRRGDDHAHTRGEAYRRRAELLGIEPGQCHIGMIGRRGLHASRGGVHPRGADSPPAPPTRVTWIARAAPCRSALPPRNPGTLRMFRRGAWRAGVRGRVCSRPEHAVRARTAPSAART